MAFSRFRPTSHFIAPHSWMNDPCGAVYVPETQEYLLCYQWNPGTAEGGNCAWGMAKSKDLVTWEDCSPALRNGSTYDRLGVFSGSIVSRLIDGQRILFLFYTSVSAVPIHWSKDYIKGCESQSVAFSKDFGRSWHRYEANPLMKDPPKITGTTGWRDPFVSPWKGLSELLGVDPVTDYMMIASGTKGRGPELHLYQSNNLLDWNPVSTILSVRAGSMVSPTSTLKFGMNFECASFFAIGERHYIIVGVEEDEDSKLHNGHYLMWMSGNLALEKGTPKFEIISHGLLDHGVSYAAHIFRDVEGRLIQLGWADETAKKQIVMKQGWAGCLAHPRELYEISKPITTLERGFDIWNVDEELGIMTTLGIRPAPQVSSLRRNIKPVSLNSFSTMRSSNYQIEATFSKLSGTEKFAFNIRESISEATKIAFDLKECQITMDRGNSSLEILGTTSSESGVFELLAGEDLHINIFVDNSIIEVYANDKFALTSRVYPSLETSIGASYDFGGFDEKNVKFTCWEGLSNAWSTRSDGEEILEEIQYVKKVKDETLKDKSIVREAAIIA
ncbi:Arabinanase/levansucrase/invertase [Acephala macrosclerotiorum]|nr:Arabinanase/levansucrase/invertase [Acephala macrosclerotiorum]